MTTDHTATASFKVSLGNVTGFDEIAIMQKFGTKIEGLGKVDSVRAVVFVDRRRNHDASDTDAYNYAQGLTINELQAYFPADEPEADALGEAARA